MSYVRYTPEEGFISTILFCTMVCEFFTFLMGRLRNSYKTELKPIIENEKKRGKNLKVEAMRKRKEAMQAKKEDMEGDVKAR